MMNSRSFTEKLVSNIPALIPMLEEHKSDNEGLLPHVFFGDVARFVSQLHKESLKKPQGADEELKYILADLEAGMASGVDEVQNLIAASFLENLDWEDSDFSKLRQNFGPRLSEMLAIMMGERF